MSAMIRKKLVTDYLDESYKKYPEHIAFVDEHASMTFAQLRQEALQIAAVLSQQTVWRKPVVVFMEKGIYCIAAFMGIAYSGNYYTPIDSSMPLERIMKILDTLQPAYIITERSKQDICASIQKEGCTAEILYWGEWQRSDSDETEKMILEIRKKMIDTDILYILFTSGSTGIPKGVIISHRSVIDYTEWLADTFHFSHEDRFGNQAPFYFDNSILDIYSTLRAGSTMYIIPEKLFTFPIELMNYLKDNQISIIFWVPSALCLVANLKALGRVELPELKKVLFCGEPMPNKQLNQWRKAYPDLLYANLYGPTEITDVCTYYVVDREFEDSESLPIGIPCDNTEILVLDDSDHLVEKTGVTGELCVRGTSLGLGYYNNAEKTKDAFVQNPLNPYYPELIYRTGDLVQYNEYGELIYLSRKDFQIKHMGHRIELGEIENAVYGMEEIKTCCCVYNDKRGKIVLFFVSDTPVEQAAIKEFLKKKIPDYMIPGVVRRLDEMPMNLNGKIDRKSLMDKM